MTRFRLYLMLGYKSGLSLSGDPMPVSFMTKAQSYLSRTPIDWRVQIINRCVW